MRSDTETMNIFRHIVVSGRIVLTTMIICSVFYTLPILGVGQVFVPYTANGSLMHNEQGETVGSAAIAQGFSRPEYFRPRPSAADYNGAATGGSNLSPANPELRKRAETILAKMAGKGAEFAPIPADLVTTSGSGVDPHITLQGALYQVPRVASARHMPMEKVTALLEQHAGRPGGALTPEPLVNVLLVNMALDKMGR
jgi:K+-transporting ATPase ATPase C chain